MTTTLPPPAEAAPELAPAPEPFDPKGFVATLPMRPGVYRMFAADGELIYVGKARQLKQRVGSYFRADLMAPKVVAMVRQIARIEVTVTRSDTEALLLEYNLIKQHRPHYNVLLKDDKTFPYLRLSAHAFPRMTFYRGVRRAPDRFFGPYPSTWAVRETVTQLQKLFRLRTCEDTYFAHRSRPCLQHQIQRCTAPCVGLISQADYAGDVESAVSVLEGRNDDVARDLGTRMEAAAEALEFERAAQLRDQLAALRKLQEQQIITSTTDTDCDAVALAEANGEYCVGLLFIRGGRSLGTTTFFPRTGVAEPEEVLSAFVAQYYLEREAPPEILVPMALEEADALEETLSARAGRKVKLHRAQRGLKAKWLEVTRENAEQALKMKLTHRAGVAGQLAALGEALGLAAPPRRIECFDISHTGGEATVASCVVFGPEGPSKTEYRRFNIEGIEPGDDYGAMRQALERRFRRIKAGESPIPDVLLIDGGKGQLAQAEEVLAALGVVVPAVVGVAKGADRRVGQERLFRLGEEYADLLPPDSPALHVVQRVRDEAHRFAITGHRRSRAKARQGSVLDDVAGLGPARRRALLKQFGGLKGVQLAGLDDLAAVQGIGPHLAQVIYDHLHAGN